MPEPTPDDIAAKRRKKILHDIKEAQEIVMTNGLIKNPTFYPAAFEYALTILVAKRFDEDE